MRKILFPAFLCLLFLSQPLRAADQEPVDDRIKIVASFSILGDMIRQVGGEDVIVDTLAGPDEEVHRFQPSPDDAKRLANAEIIAVNGLRFEGWMGRLIKASGTKAKLLIASAGVKPRILMDKAEQKAQGLAPHETPVDPHAWQDLRNGQLYVRNILGALTTARPDKAEAFKQRAKAYTARLEALDRQAREKFAKLSENERKVITNHDAFGYFAQAYGLRFLAPVGLTNEAQPSASGLAKLMKQMKAEGVTTLFIENMSDPRLIEQLAKDTGAKIGGTLYADALTKPDGEAPTYLEMMKVNIRRLLGEN